MARTLIAPTNLQQSAPLAPVTTAIDVANGMYLAAGVGNMPNRLVLVVNNTAVTAQQVTIKAGVNPPALRAAIGDLVFSVGASATASLVIEGSRHVQNNGTVNVDFEAGTTGTVTAYRVPDNA